MFCYDFYIYVLFCRFYVRSEYFVHHWYDYNVMSVFNTKKIQTIHKKYPNIYTFLSVCVFSVLNTVTKQFICHIGLQI